MHIPLALLAALVAHGPALADDVKAPLPFANVPADSYKLHKNVAYVRDGGPRQTLDLYVPTLAPNTPAPPLVVWVHGGGWEGGSKDVLVAPFPYVAKGFAVASINYRLSRQAAFPAQIHDCKAAVRWLRANAATYGYDPNRIGVWGASAGGHLAALLGTTAHTADLDGDGGNPGVSSRVQAVCDWFGPTDLLGWAQEAGPDSYLNRNSPLTRLLGGPVLDNADLAKRANPITHVKGDAPPFLIMHGTADPLVPTKQSELLAESLKKAGVPVTLEVLQGAGHGNGFVTPKVSGQVEAFFRDKLKVPAAKP